MKKSLVLFGISLGVVAASYAAPVTLPGSDVLSHRLRAEGWAHFIEKTNIIDRLAGQEKEALGVICTVELAFYDYEENMKSPIPWVRIREQELVETILDGHPEAIEEARARYAEKARLESLR